MSGYGPGGYYRAYDLGIDSELCLPELSIDEGATDLRVRLGGVKAQPRTLDVSGRGCWTNGTQACYVLKGVGAFEVSEGKRILVEPWEGAVGEALRLSLLGPVMALLLLQLGKFVLHAGAIVIDGAAVVFLGGHAWGKSTLVAMLHARGHQFLCDDVAGLKCVGGETQVIPSFAQFKLWPDAAERLGWSPADFPQIHPDCEKRLIGLRNGVSEVPMLLRRLYVLRVGPHVCVERLRPVERLAEILKHWYGGRFGPEFLRSLDRRELFRRAAELARTVPLSVLRRPASFHQDPGLAEAVERVIVQDLKCPVE